MRSFLTSIVLVILVSSCQDAKQVTPQASTPSVPVKQEKSITQAPVQTGQAPAQTASDDVSAMKSRQFDYMYNPIQKRDPFKPYEGEANYFDDRERTPLERYDISQLKLTGIVWGISEPRALVQTPDGQFYIIKKDMRVGRNSGKITRITKKEVVIAEEYRDPLGKLIVKETPMLLREKLSMSKLMEELQ